MRVLVSVLLTGLLLATPAAAARVTLPGQVTYRERIALPDQATLEIQLVDQTVPSLPPRLAVRAPIGPGDVPLAFNLAFDDQLILPGHTYALIAAISAGGGLLFRNFEPYVVDPLAPAQPVVVVLNLVGRIETGSSSEAADAEPLPPAILDAKWTATAIKGQPVLPRTGPSLSIGSDMRAGGSTGCNSWFAQVQLTGEDRLQLGSVTATPKACTQPIAAQEQAFKDALAAAVRWQVSGETLRLFALDGTALLVFNR